ncbi:hypothetical protein OTU49_010843 [Cherax quadricarinatus]|uniref:Uncharacterized protein n=1 Tax=Cherax quadricarinatus TaxID=27406 RepID=A0AAW0WGW6_CHEQU
MDTQDPARLSLVQAAADEARFFVYAYNATTLVTTAGLVLGIFFVVTAVALYLYYLVQEEKLKKKNWEYKGGNYRQDKSGGVYLGVVELLEQAWALYNIEGQDCRRSLVCEAHLPTASHVNFPVSETLKHLLGKTEQVLSHSKDGILQWLSPDVREHYGQPGYETHVCRRS